MRKPAVSSDEKDNSFHSGGEAMATFLRRSIESPASEAAGRVLKEAGLGVIEVREW